MAWVITMYWKTGSYLKKNLVVQVLKAGRSRTSNDCKVSVRLMQIDLSQVVQQDMDRFLIKLPRRHDPDACVCISIALTPILQEPMHSSISASSAITGTSLA